MTCLTRPGRPHPARTIFRAWLRYILGDPDGASRALDRIGPDDRTPRYFLLRASLEPESAHRLIEEAWERFPGDAQLSISYAALCAQRGQIERARELVRDAEERALYPSHAEVAAVARLDLDLAEAAGDAMAELGVLPHDERNRRSAVAAVAARARELLPRLSDRTARSRLLTQVALASHLLGATDSARAALRRAMDIDPNEPSPRLALASIVYWLRHPDPGDLMADARAAIEELLDPARRTSDPTSTRLLEEAYTLAAGLAYRRDDAVELTRLLDEAEARIPRPSEAFASNMRGFRAVLGALISVTRSAPAGSAAPTTRCRWCRWCRRGWRSTAR